MRLMMLGAGKLQLNAIQRIQERGIEVVAVDYNEHAPGKALADYSGLASTFDLEPCYEIAKAFNIDGIMTTGTDQPVWTAAVIAERLNLPFYITAQTAFEVTNKKAMKERFQKAGIPSVSWRLIERGCPLNANDWTFPLVLKPVDSQGQRGIYLVHSFEELLEKAPLSFSYTKSRWILAEAYYPNQEVTVSGWVDEGCVHVICITDRVTFDATNKLGICVSHEYPTIHLETQGPRIRQLTQQIVEAFEIKNGPIYFQMLVGKEGVMVNEIACRIGGAYEDLWIPRVSEVDLLAMNVDYCLHGKADTAALKQWTFPDEYGAVKPLSIQLFFAESGRVKRMTPKEVLMALPGMIYFDANYIAGDQIPAISNASQRAGAFVVEADSEAMLKERISCIYKNLVFEGVDHSNLVIQGKRGNRHD